MGKTMFSAKPGERTTVTTRTFDMPRERVYEAMTDPALVPQWWGPEGYKTTVEKMDVRPGGKWRGIQHDGDGKEYAFSGEYREVKPPERLVYTFNYEAEPGHESVETITFNEHDGQTTVTDEVMFQSVEDRDNALKTGMKEGATESMERFAKLVAKK